MLKSVKNSDLAEGMRLALPFNNVCTIVGTPKVGTKYVTFRFRNGLGQEAGSRVEVHGETMIEVPEPQQKLAIFKVTALGRFPDDDVAGEALVEIITTCVESAVEAAQNRLNETLGESVVTLEVMA